MARRFSKKQFIGKEALLKINDAKLKKKLVSFIMKDRGIPRSGYEIFIESKKVGVVTSGTQSPTLKNGIGLAYIDFPFYYQNKEIFIKIRGQLIRAKIVKPPFIKNTSLYH